jgi:hypothetical protein
VSGGKHRRGGVKTKHGRIPGLDAALAPVAALASVGVIIPGRIRRTGRARGGPFLTTQAATVNGVKLAAHGAGVVQEVFVVTTDPAAVRAMIEARHPPGGHGSLPMEKGTR